MTPKSLFFLYALCLISLSNGQDPPETWGTSISQGEFSPMVETELLSREGTGCMTYLWLTENDEYDAGQTILRLYVDDSPPIEFRADALAGIGWADESAPWGHEHFGKGAYYGAVYTTLRVPYGQRLRITGQTPPGTKDTVVFWWVVRGVEPAPLFIGGYQLPEAARLKLYSKALIMKPVDYVDWVNTNNSGAVWMTQLTAQSGNLNFLEGCVRMYLKGSSNPTLLASGTEDYFQSAFYFDAGTFYFPEAGLTHFEPSVARLSAYKVHDRDSLFFKKGGFRMTWRNGEYYNPRTGFKCVDSGALAGSPQVSNVTLHAWVYEW